jgi:integrase/recombinase XerC
MSRNRKGPWRRGQNGHWHTTIGRKIVKVADKGESYEAAFQKYVELLNVRDIRPAALTVAALLDHFLDWTQGNRADSTYKWYQRFAQSFVDHVGKRLKVTDLKQFHVQNWISAKFRDSTDTTKHGLIRAIQRPLNWGVKNGLVDRSPLIGIEKPSRKPREAVLTEEQFQQMLRYVGGQEFIDYLTFIWETGCRAQEIRVIEWRHRDGDKIILELANSKGEKYNRVIYLNETAGAIIDRLSKRTGPIFRNSNGKPWTANSVRCRFKTLKRKMNMPDLCATTLRHSWATNSLKNGMDSTTASILMGHRDPSTLIRNYQHLAKDHEYLARAAEAARKGAVVTPLTPATAIDSSPTVQA